MAHIYREGRHVLRVSGGALPMWHEKQWRNEIRKKYTRIDYIYAWLKKKLHRHKWKLTRLMNKEHKMIFTTRECECGKKEIKQRFGGFVPIDSPWTFVWEKEWFESAIPWDEMK